MIRRVEAFDLRLPLKTPYHTALGDLGEFTTLVVVIEDDAGRMGAGDGTPVLGYSWEGPEDVWKFARAHGGLLPGLAPEKAYDLLAREAKASPFACAPFLTALEMITGDPVLALPEGGFEIPMVGLCNIRTADEAPDAVAKLMAEGFKTIKFKVGFQVDGDIVRARAVQEALGDRGLMRIDANQHYSFEDALKFVQSVDPGNIELFEQPFESNQWEPMIELAKVSPLPLMMDESIYGEEDIDKVAATKCAQIVKLKLMKSGSANRFASEINQARDLGLKVVIGNGVASEIGCYHESMVAANVGLKTAGEQNGLLKPRDSLLLKPVVVKNGNMLAEPGFQLELNRDMLETLSRERMAWA